MKFVSFILAKEAVTHCIFINIVAFISGNDTKYNHLIANLMIFHNCHTMTQAFKELEKERMKLTPELAAAFSPYRTHHANRFGKYELRERALEPIDYGVTFQM